MPTAKSKKKGSLPFAEKGQPGRLPVARSKSAAPPALLAGRGGENAVAVWSDFDGALDDLPGLAQELLRINKQKADLEAEAEGVRHAIRGLMQEVKANESWTVRSENSDWVATYVVPKEGRKLVPELLVAAGVTKKQLEKGYKIVPAKKPYVQVRTKGEDSGSNEEHE